MTKTKLYIQDLILKIYLQPIWAWIGDQHLQFAMLTLILNYNTIKKSLIIIQTVVFPSLDEDT